MQGISYVIDHDCASRTLQANECKSFFPDLPDCNAFRLGAFIVGTGVNKNTGGRRISRIERACRGCKLLNLRPTVENDGPIGSKNAEGSCAVCLNLFDNSVAINVTVVAGCKRDSQVADCTGVQQIAIFGNQLRV